MTTPAWVLVALAGVVALVDWWAVWRERKRLEYVAKPAVMVLLVAAALALDPASEWVRGWFVVALLFGLGGDVLLMVGRFVPGAASFLVGHLAYVTGLAVVEHPLPAVVLGLVVVGADLWGPGRCIVRGARQRSRTLGAVVVLYQLALGAVVVLAVGSWSTTVGLAALLFLASDTLLGWGRFVGSAPGGRVLVHVTYHLAQALFVLALPTLG